MAPKKKQRAELGDTGSAGSNQGNQGEFSALTRAEMQIRMSVLESKLQRSCEEKKALELECERLRGTIEDVTDRESIAKQIFDKERKDSTLQLEHVRETYLRLSEEHDILLKDHKSSIDTLMVDHQATVSTLEAQLQEVCTQYEEVETFRKERDSLYQSFAELKRDLENARSETLLQEAQWKERVKRDRHFTREAVVSKLNQTREELFRMTDEHRELKSQRLRQENERLLREVSVYEREVRTLAQQITQLGDQHSQLTQSLAVEKDLNTELHRKQHKLVRSLRTAQEEHKARTLADIAKYRDLELQFEEIVQQYDELKGELAVQQQRNSALVAERDAQQAELQHLRSAREQYAHGRSTLANLRLRNANNPFIPGVSHLALPFVSTQKMTETVRTKGRTHAHTHREWNHSSENIENNKIHGGGNNNKHHNGITRKMTTPSKPIIQDPFVMGSSFSDHLLERIINAVGDCLPLFRTWAILQEDESPATTTTDSDNDVGRTDPGTQNRVMSDDCESCSTHEVSDRLCTQVGTDTKSSVQWDDLSLMQRLPHREKEILLHFIGHRLGILADAPPTAKLDEQPSFPSRMIPSNGSADSFGLQGGVVNDPIHSSSTLSAPLYDDGRNNLPDVTALHHTSDGAVIPQPRCKVPATREYPTRVSCYAPPRPLRVQPPDRTPRLAPTVAPLPDGAKDPAEFQKGREARGNVSITTRAGSNQGNLSPPRTRRLRRYQFHDQDQKSKPQVIPSMKVSLPVLDAIRSNIDAAPNASMNAKNRTPTRSRQHSRIEPHNHELIP